MDIQEVVKRPQGSPIEVPFTITINSSASDCPQRMSFSHQASFYLYSAGPNSEGIYKLAQGEDCILTKLATTTKGLLNIGTYTLSLRQISALAQSTGNVRSLTIDPDDITRNQKNGTITFTPNSRVRRSSYTHYIFDQKQFEAILGPQLIEPIEVFVDLDQVQKSIHRPDRALPQPESGFQITKYRARVITKL